ncbi:MAG: glycosyltransferase [Ilumatobacteraceae bacterium]
MPTYNRRQRLERVLRSLAAQDAGVPFEVVVVSDGSTDGTDEYLASTDVPLPVRRVSQANAGPAAARNRGVAESHGDLIVFLDDDVVAAPDLVRRHVDEHAIDDSLVTIGPMLDPDDHDMSAWVRWEQLMLRKQYEAMRKGVYEATARQFYTGNAAIRRCHLDAVGGFDENFRRAEDVELAYRLEHAGLRFRYLPEAVGFHYAERSYDSWRTAAYTYGRNDVVFARDRGEDWIFSFIGEKLDEHRTPLRWLIRATATRPTLARATATSAGAVAKAAARLGGTRVPRVLLSAVYAIEYHRGVADEVGDADALKRLFG